MAIADDLRMLIRKEIELARIELIEGLKAQLIGAGVIMLAVVSLLPALLFAVLAFIHWLPFSLAVSYAIVSGGMVLLVAIVALIGVRIMKSRRPKLDKSVASIKEDVRWAREQLTN